MLRFLSRRKNRNVIPENNSHIKSQRIPTNKNLVAVRVILLDGTDISVDLSVSRRRSKKFFIILVLVAKIASNFTVGSIN
jgi:hypothetical protein